MNTNSKVVYRIDAKDNIVFVNDHWHDFAVSNDASDFTIDHVLNRPIWSFVSDHKTRHFYREVIDRVRTTTPVSFNFRCDSPDQRRLLKMTISARHDEVEFESEVLKVERRPWQMMLDRQIARSEELLVVCGWCKRVNIGEAIWKEIEHAVEALRIFERDRMPHISHGMCLACYESLYRDLKVQFSQ